MCSRAEATSEADDNASMCRIICTICGMLTKDKLEGGGRGRNKDRKSCLKAKTRGMQQQMYRMVHWFASESHVSLALSMLHSSCKRKEFTGRGTARKQQLICRLVLTVQYCSRPMLVMAHYTLVFLLFRTKLESLSLTELFVSVLKLFISDSVFCLVHIRHWSHCVSLSLSFLSLGVTVNGRDGLRMDWVLSACGTTCPNGCGLSRVAHLYLHLYLLGPNATSDIDLRGMAMWTGSNSRSHGPLGAT